MDPPPPPGAPPALVVAGAGYAAGPLRRWLLGSEYRDLWVTPLRVPVLDPASFRHGLRPVREGGGLQSIVLHLRDREGRYYLFRSVDKRIYPSLPEDLQGTLAGWIIQDQTKAFHPAGHWVISAIEEAVGIPHTVPEMYVMSDHPALGQYRERYAGILGMLVESPDHGEDGQLRFMGSSEVLGSQDLLDRLRETPTNRVDSEAFLKARLVDLLVGDPDRGFGQWRWLRYGREGAWTWKAVPMDRDAAFLMGDGVAGAVGRRLAPKYVRYDAGIDVTGLVQSQPEVDRLLLADLDRAAWERAVADVRSAVTDAVIERAVGALPPEYQDAGTGFLTRHLASGRDALPAAADQFYRLLAREVDVQATDADEVVVVDRRPDGSLEVSLNGPRAVEGVLAEADEGLTEGRYYHRRFLPEETREVRVYLRGGNDRAVVRGSGSPITVRIIGGPGNDVLVDSTTAGGGGKTIFYDHEGEDVFIGESRARLDRRPWERPVVTDYAILTRSSLTDEPEENRDFGVERGLRFQAGYGDAAGVILGVGLQRTDFAFRRLPFGRHFHATASFGTRSRGVGLDVGARKQLEGREAVQIEVRLSRDLAEARFHDFGNDAPAQPAGSPLSLADEVAVEAFLERALGDHGTVSLGPTLRYFRPDGEAASPLARLRPLGWDGFGQVGVRAALGLDFTAGAITARRGVTVSADASAHPPLWDAPTRFGGASLEVRGYVPVGSTNLALRAGARSAWGDFPFHEAATLGGGRMLRGFRFGRFAGDAAAYGGAEWRVRLAGLTLLTHGRVGAFGLTDVGRVWLDGASPGGWHHGSGGGLWYETMGLAGSLAYARGEEDRVYLYLGLPF